MRWMSRLASAIVTFTVVAGPPLAVGWWAAHTGWSIPRTADLRAWWEQPLTPGTVVAAFALIVATGWFALTVTLVRHTMRRLRRTWLRLRHVPMPSPAQMTATSMAGVAALTLPTPDTGPVPVPSGASADHTPPASSLGGGSTEASDSASRAAGIPLPGGGWIPFRTALAVTAITAAIWVHRRQSYLPQAPRPGTHLTDSDLQQLPATGNLVTAAVDHYRGRDSHDALNSILPPGLITLAGDGAVAAVRGLVVTTALQHVLAAESPRQLGISRDDLHLALPEANADTLEVLGISITDPPGIGETAVQGSAKAAPHPANGPSATVIRLGLLGEGTPWKVDSDGTTSTPTGRTRMCVLDQGAAMDLLTLTQRCPSGTVDTTAAAPPRAVTARVRTRDSRPGHLAVIGDCRIMVHDASVHLRRTAAQQLLAYLALHPDGVTTPELIRGIWPGLPSNAITNRLYTTVTEVRRQLRPLLGSDPVIRRDDRYHLNTAAIASDLTTLRQAMNAARRAKTAAERHHAARDIGAAYPGELAAGHTWPWLLPHREALHRDVIDTILTLVTNLEQSEAENLLAAAAEPGTGHAGLDRQVVEAVLAVTDLGHSGRA